MALEPWIRKDLLFLKRMLLSQECILGFSVAVFNSYTILGGVMQRRRVLIAVIDSVFFFGLSVDNTSPDKIEEFSPDVTVVDLVTGSEIPLREAKEKGVKISSVFLTEHGSVIGTSFDISVREWVELMADEVDLEQVEVNLERLRSV